MVEFILELLSIAGLTAYVVRKQREMSCMYWHCYQDATNITVIDRLKQATVDFWLVDEHNEVHKHHLFESNQ